MQYTSNSAQDPKVTVSLVLPDGTVLERTARLRLLGNPRYWMTETGEALEEIWGDLRMMGAAAYGEPPKR